MKSKTIILIFLAMFLSISCTNKDQARKIELITSFLKDATNPNIENAKLVADHMCGPSTGLNGSLRMLVLSPLFKIFRTDLINQPDDVKSNFAGSIKSYKSLPSDEQNLILAQGDEDNVFSFNGARNLSFLILIRDGKIISFTVEHRGADKRSFVETCGS